MPARSDLTTRRRSPNCAEVARWKASARSPLVMTLVSPVQDSTLVLTTLSVVSNHHPTALTMAVDVTHSSPRCLSKLPQKSLRHARR